jgi:steroid delta-isomerase-like uncharacterized protein
VADATTQAAGIERAFIEDFLPRWQEAWNSHVPQRLLALMTEDVVYDDSASPETMRGHGDVHTFLDRIWRAMPDLRFEARGGPLLDPDQPRAAFWWRGEGTFMGPLNPPGFAPTGARINFEGADFHEYRDGRVAKLRIVFDMTDVARQIGVVPRPGSVGERAGAAVQRLGARLKRRR